MSCSGNRKETDTALLELARDIPLTADDLAALREPLQEQDPNLETYLDFLEELGAFDNPKPPGKAYPETFEL